MEMVHLGKLIQTLFSTGGNNVSLINTTGNTSKTERSV